jgi:HlyD family secretion protein
MATLQSTTGTEEAKDFKVIVTLDAPSSDLRPGLSSTAKITTAYKANALSLPIQALTIRNTDDDKDKSKNVAQAASTSSTSAAPKTAPPQGVYVVNKDERGKLRVKFVTVTTGITGATDIEVLTGLKEGDEIVIGPYKTLRGLKNNALVKRDTAKPIVAASSGNS